jgi:CheY-like chemotaxis protein
LKCVPKPVRRFFVEGPVWLVDDTECALEIIRLFLEKSGISTVIYSCPLKALHDLEQGQLPQLVVTDFSMPKMSGTEFLDAVKSIIPDVPAIIITGDPSPIPSHYKHVPIIEKGQINFIHDLLNQIRTLQQCSPTKTSFKNGKKIPRTTLPNAGVLSKKKKSNSREKILASGKGFVI